MNRTTKMIFDMCGVTWHRRVLQLLSFLIVLCALFGTRPAHADCSRTTNLGDISVSLPAVVNVPTNAAVGTIVASVTVPVTGATAGLTYASCSGSGTFLYWAIVAGPVQANRTGSTSVPGIGYTTSLSGGGFAGNVVMDSALNPASLPGGPTAPKFTSQLFVTINLVVTGPVKAGPIAVNPSGSYGTPNVLGVFYVGNGAVSLFRVVTPANQSTVSMSGCSVNTTALAVTLPQAHTSALMNVGATTGAQQFNLSLTCPAGINVNVTFTDASKPSNTTNTLGLAPGSTAGGVGLQILNGTTPIAYGPDSAAVGNLNQWSAGVSTDGVFNIPLTAQYVRTSAALNPGTVKGMATFTMSYQ
jgi:type 1 fimbria pilin